MSKNKNSIQWKRISAEGAAIVVSILLAFGIEAWWAERQDRAEEQLILQGLQLEFAAIEEKLVEHKRLLLLDLDALRAMLRMLAGQADTTPEVLDLALEDMLRPLTSDIANGTLHALLGSGQLEILSDRELRQNLVDWEGVMGEVWDDQDAHAKMIYEIHIPYFVAGGYLAGATMEVWFPELWQLETSQLSADPVALERLLSDPAFHSMVQIRYGYRLHLIQEFDAALVAIAEILERVAHSID